MARAGITKMATTVQFSKCVGERVIGAKNLLQETAKQCKVADDDDGKKASEGIKDSSWWVPHRRTGIYYPQGHEAVVDDIPDGAATLQGKTYWLRNVDGVDMINLE